MNDEQTPALREAVENMATMRQAYDSLSQAAEAYNTGKVQLAENITKKGIPASATETLPELAEKVGDIAQTQTILEGGEVMAAQQFGNGALWNLYQVLADMKTRFMGTGQYSSIIVCEYYKGYDSLQLQGADAYYTCDGDFYDYDALHTWHDSENGKSNRWVCFLYQQDGARLDITNTAISPRSMYIGGHISTIEYFVNGRLTDLVCGVEETDVVDNFLSHSYTQPWGFNCVLRNVGNLGDQFITSSRGTVVLSNKSIPNNTETGNIIVQNCTVLDMPELLSIIKGPHSRNTLIIGPDCIEVSAPKATTLQQYNWYLIGGNTSGLKRVNFGASTNIQMFYNGSCCFIDPTNNGNLEDVIVGALVYGCDLRNWNPINVLADTTKKARLIDNIKNHILALVSDATGGTQLVFTISTNMYNAITSENIEWQGETMSLADAFLTKNWLLAGA